MLDSESRFGEEQTRRPGQTTTAERPDSLIYEAWWAARWHAGITFVGTPLHFLAAVRDGLGAFRREFGRTFSQRWTHGEREEAYHRFINVK